MRLLEVVEVRPGIESAELAEELSWSPEEAVGAFAEAVRDNRVDLRTSALKKLSPDEILQLDLTDQEAGGVYVYLAEDAPLYADPERLPERPAKYSWQCRRCGQWTQGNEPDPLPSAFEEDLTRFCVSCAEVIATRNWARAEKVLPKFFDANDPDGADDEVWTKALDEALTEAGLVGLEPQWQLENVDGDRYQLVGLRLGPEYVYPELIRTGSGWVLKRSSGA